jgi:hypothetical protein
VAIAETALTQGLAARSGPQRTQVIVHLDVQTLTGTAWGDRCELEDGPDLAPAVARRLACDASLVPLIGDGAGQPLSVGRSTRAISPTLRRALRSRDQGCAFPGCHQTRFVEGHHIQHWAAGGETSLANLVTLCWYHHHLMHEGGYRLEVTAPGAFDFFRPNGTQVERIPKRSGPHDGDLRIPIDASKALTRWTGERMDLGYVISCMADGDSRLRGDPPKPPPKQPPEDAGAG